MTDTSVPPPTVPDAIADLVRSARRVTVLTGAGMSAESGVPTFRDAQTGLWARYDPVQLATPEAWYADRDMVWAWYMWRAALVRRVSPNAGHEALARWARQPDRTLTIATQNVDDLHERAGSQVAAHVHGSLFAPRCERCETPYDVERLELPDPDDPPAQHRPPQCGVCGSAVRPGVVWFGEMLPPRELEAATVASEDADVALVVGTSGIVYPFAALPSKATAHGVPVVEINPVETALTPTVDHTWRATAATALPALADLAAG